MTIPYYGNNGSFDLSTYVFQMGCNKFQQIDPQIGDESHSMWNDQKQHIPPK